MSNVIDLSDPLTYPDFLIDSFNNDYEIEYDLLFKEYYFKCCHVCCTSDINNYIRYGIVRPYYVNLDGTKKINKKLKEIILEPLRDDDDYEKYSLKYDELLEKTYEEKKNDMPNWYGKYSCIHYTLDDLSKINVNNPAYEPMIRCYGGEIFRDLGISDKQAEEIAIKYKSYAIFFRLSYEEMNEKNIYFPRVIEHMKLIYKNEKSPHGFENNVNKDINFNDFIEIIEVKK